MPLTCTVDFIRAAYTTNSTRFNEALFQNVFNAVMKYFTTSDVMNTCVYMRHIHIRSVQSASYFNLIL